MVLIIGTPDSGKSVRAEKLFESDSQNSNKSEYKNTYYIATMIPFGEEGIKRVEKHRKMRAGKGFTTIECPVNVSSILGKTHKESRVLLECMSNLIGNEIYKEEHKSWSDEEIVSYIISEISLLNDFFKYLVVVSNEFNKNDEDYDEETLRYIDIVSKVNTRLKDMADITEILEDGEWKHYENI